MRGKNLASMTICTKVRAQHCERCHVRFCKTIQLLLCGTSDAPRRILEGPISSLRRASTHFSDFHLVQLLRAFIPANTVGTQLFLPGS